MTGRRSVNTVSAVTEVVAGTQKIRGPLGRTFVESYRTEPMRIPAAVRYSMGRTHYPQ